MQTNRVLILESVDDALTRRRSKHLSESPILQGYIVEHCYAVEISEQDRKKPTPVMMEDVISRPLKSEDLLIRIEEKIRSFQPNFLLLHTGFVFHANLQTFIEVLRNLKTKYPNIKLGYQGRSEFENRFFEEGIFDQSSEIKKLENLFFYKIYGR